MKRRKGITIQNGLRLLVLMVLVIMCIVLIWNPGSKRGNLESGDIPGKYIQLESKVVPELSSEESVLEEIESVETAESSESSESIEPIEASSVVPVKEFSTYFDVPLDRDLQDHIFTVCERYGVDPALIVSMIFHESTYRDYVVGDNGNCLYSYGLMQIIPEFNHDRMDRLGCPDLLDPYQNVAVGIDLVAEYLDQGSVEWALMAYNGGPGYANEKVSEGVVSEYARKIIQFASQLERK